MGFLAIIPVLKDLIQTVIPDPQKKMELTLQLAQLEQQEAQRESTERLAQINVNNTEATNPNLFVAGWRPFIGWVCGAGAALNFVVLPIAGWSAQVIFGYHGSLPEADMANLMTLLGGMLGFGYLRSKDKQAGVEDTTIVSQRQLDKKPGGILKKLGRGQWPF